ncbi:MAG: hypothetical protein ACFFG0_52015, partial [Candidatus Thorarchaeota archaeon]
EVGDFSDVLYSSWDIPTLKNTKYITNSKIVKTEIPAKGKLKILWQPNTEIRNGDSYIHKYKWSFEKGFEDPTAFWCFHPQPHSTLISIFNIKCQSNDLERIIFFKQPFFLKLNDGWQVIDYGLQFETINSIYFNEENKYEIKLLWPYTKRGFFIIFLFYGWERSLEKEKEGAGNECILSFTNQMKIEKNIWKLIEKQNINRKRL